MVVFLLGLNGKFSILFIFKLEKEVWIEVERIFEFCFDDFLIEIEVGLMERLVGRVVVIEFFIIGFCM